MTKNVLDFVKLVYPEACKIGNISPVFITAQGGLESGWGERRVGNFNLFGMKAPNGWQGKTILVKTTEFLSTNKVKFPKIYSITKQSNGNFKYIVDDWFCDFDSVEECLQYHFTLLQKPQFAHALPFKNDPIKYVTELQSGKLKYATDPNYVTVITSIIKMVQNAIKTLNL